MSEELTQLPWQKMRVQHTTAHASSPHSPWQLRLLVTTTRLLRPKGACCCCCIWRPALKLLLLCELLCVRVATWGCVQQQVDGICRANGHRTTHAHE